MPHRSSPGILQCPNCAISGVLWLFSNKASSIACPEVSNTSDRTLPISRRWHPPRSSTLGSFPRFYLAPMCRRRVKSRNSRMSRGGMKLRAPIHCGPQKFRPGPRATSAAGRFLWVIGESACGTCAATFLSTGASCKSLRGVRALRWMRYTLTTPEGGSVTAIWRPITGFMRRSSATANTAGRDSGGLRRNKRSRTA